jgi:hypothetical protein
MFKILMLLDHTTLYMSLHDLQQFPRTFAYLRLWTERPLKKPLVVSQKLVLGSGSWSVSPLIIQPDHTNKVAEKCLVGEIWCQFLLADDH